MPLAATSYRCPIWVSSVILLTTQSMIIWLSVFLRLNILDQLVYGSALSSRYVPTWVANSIYRDSESSACFIKHPEGVRKATFVGPILQDAQLEFTYSLLAEPPQAFGACLSFPHAAIHAPFLEFLMRAGDVSRLLNSD